MSKNLVDIINGSPLVVVILPNECEQEVDNAAQIYASKSRRKETTTIRASSLHSVPYPTPELSENFSDLHIPGKRD